MHMNHPEGETAQGVIEAIPEMKKRGFRFVKLSEIGLR
jgi:peptidoglycan/xylan/chitin deacetylase (PgdA/CDA1 family)